MALAASPPRHRCSRIAASLRWPEHFPRQFGKYVLAEVAGARRHGGDLSGGVRARPGASSKLCVIKKVIAEKADRAKANRFLDEAKVVLRLSHANLVSTFDAGEVDGELFIAMELVEGKDLREIWNRCVRTRTRIPLDVALYVGARDRARAGLRPHLRRICAWFTATSRRPTSCSATSAR